MTTPRTTHWTGIELRKPIPKLRAPDVSLAFGLVSGRCQWRFATMATPQVTASTSSASPHRPSENFPHEGQRDQRLAGERDRPDPDQRSAHRGEPRANRPTMPVVGDMYEKPAANVENRFRRRCSC